MDHFAEKLRQGGSFSAQPTEDEALEEKFFLSCRDGEAIKTLAMVY